MGNRYTPNQDVKVDFETTALAEKQGKNNFSSDEVIVFFEKMNRVSKSLNPSERDLSH